MIENRLVGVKSRELVLKRAVAHSGLQGAAQRDPGAGARGCCTFKSWAWAGVGEVRVNTTASGSRRSRKPSTRSSPPRSAAWPGTKWLKFYKGDPAPWWAAKSAYSLLRLRAGTTTRDDSFRPRTRRPRAIAADAVNILMSLEPSAGGRTGRRFGAQKKVGPLTKGAYRRNASVEAGGQAENTRRSSKKRKRPCRRCREGKGGRYGGFVIPGDSPRT